MAEGEVEVRMVEEGVRVASQRVVGAERQVVERRASASVHVLSRVLCRRGWICGPGRDRGHPGTCRSSALADRDTGPESDAGLASGAEAEVGVNEISSPVCDPVTVSVQANSSGGRAIAAVQASTCSGSGRSDRGRLFCRPSRVGPGGTCRGRGRVHGHDTFPSLGHDPATYSANAAAAEVTAIASFPGLGPDRVHGRDPAHAAARVTSTAAATGQPSVAPPSSCHHSWRPPPRASAAEFRAESETRVSAWTLGLLAQARPAR